MMLPLLKIASDGKEHQTRNVAERLAAEFKLTETEHNELLRTACQRRLGNRVHWVISHNYHARLIFRIRALVY